MHQPDGEVIFFENFDDQEAFDKTWTVSANSEYSGESDVHEPRTFTGLSMLHVAGTWGLSEGKTAVQSGDMGLEVKNEARRHGASKFRLNLGLR